MTRKVFQREGNSMLGSNSTCHLNLNGLGMFPFSQSPGTHCILIIPECKQIGCSSKTGQQNTIKKHLTYGKRWKGLKVWELCGRKPWKEVITISKHWNSVNKRLEEELLGGGAVQKVMGYIWTMKSREETSLWFSISIIRWGNDRIPLKELVGETVREM